MGLFDFINDVYMNALEKSEHRKLQNEIMSKILQRFSEKQLKSLYERYGSRADPYFSLDDVMAIERTTSYYLRYAEQNIQLDEVKDFAKANRIQISDILKEEPRKERELVKNWEAVKSKGLVPDPAKDNLLLQVINAIEDFQPTKVYRIEKGYHIELLIWMKAHFKEATVEPQTGSSRPDIVIDKRIAIEVKGPTDSKDLKTITDKCNRYCQYYNHLIVVLFAVEVNDGFYDEWLKGIKDRYREVIIIRK